MWLLLLRHGPAEAATLGQPDHDRSLTSEGKQLIHHIAKQFQKLLSPPSLLVSSSYRRSYQTAEIFSHYFPNVPLYQEDFLQPSTPVEEAQNALQALLTEPGIIAVTHQPLLTALIQRFCSTPSLQLRLPPASAALLELSSRYAPAIILGIFPPSIFSY